MNILSLSDKVESFIYSSSCRDFLPGVDLILGCGDLPYYYLEFVLDSLQKPVFFVRGNHDSLVEYGTAGQRTQPLGAIDLHNRVIHFNGLLLAGIEGSLRYKLGPFMYTQMEMWLHVILMTPKLLMNKLLHGRSLDIFVTHASPWQIHDKEDMAHQGVRAFRWLLKVFKPAIHFHGHIHVYSNTTEKETLYKETRVINTYGHLITPFELPFSRRTEQQVHE